MYPNMQRAMKLGIKQIHHQRGAFPSHNPAIWLEIQPKLRLFATSGTRCSSGGGCGNLAETAGAVIMACSLAPTQDALIHRHRSSPRVFRTRPTFFRTPGRSKVNVCNPALRDSGFALLPDRSGAVWLTEIQEPCSRARVPSVSKRDFRDL